MVSSDWLLGPGAAARSLIQVRSASCTETAAVIPAQRELRNRQDERFPDRVPEVNLGHARRDDDRRGIVVVLVLREQQVDRVVHIHCERDQAAPTDNLRLRVGWGVTGNQEFPAGAAQEYFTYENGKTSDKLYVPVGQPIKVKLTSKDVLHSFYVPQMLAGVTSLGTLSLCGGYGPWLVLKHSVPPRGLFWLACRILPAV